MLLGVDECVQSYRQRSTLAPRQERAVEHGDKDEDDGVVIVGTDVTGP